MRLLPYREVFRLLVDCNFVIAWNSVLLRQRVAIQDRADYGMIGRSFSVRPFIGIQVKPEPITGEVEEPESNGRIHPPILFRPQRTADASEIIIRSFTVISFEFQVRQIYREILAQFLREARMSLRLVCVHVKEKLTLAAFISPPLVNIDVD